MTADEFDAHGWRRGDKVVYDNVECDVDMVNFPNYSLTISRNDGIFHKEVLCSKVNLIKPTNKIETWKGNEFYPEDDKRCRDGKPCSRKGKDCSWCELND